MLPISFVVLIPSSTTFTFSMISFYVWITSWVYFKFKSNSYSAYIKTAIYECEYDFENESFPGQRCKQITCKHYRYFMRYFSILILDRCNNRFFNFLFEFPEFRFINVNHMNHINQTIRYFRCRKFNRLFSYYVNLREGEGGRGDGRNNEILIF